MNLHPLSSILTSEICKAGRVSAINPCREVSLNETIELEDSEFILGSFSINYLYPLYSMGLAFTSI